MLGGAERGGGTGVTAVPLVVEAARSADRDAVRVRGHDVLLRNGVGVLRHPTRGGVGTRPPGQRHATNDQDRH